MEEIAGQPVVGFDADLTIRREIDRVLHLHDVEVRVVMEFDNVETIKRAIEIDAGVGLLPQPTVVREVAAGTLAAVPLATDELVRPLGIIHRRGKDLGVTVRRFIDLLCNEAKDSEGRESDGKNLHDDDMAAGSLAVTGRRENGLAGGDIVGHSGADAGEMPAAAPANGKHGVETAKTGSASGKSDAARTGRTRRLAVAQSGM